MRFLRHFSCVVQQETRLSVKSTNESLPAAGYLYTLNNKGTDSGVKVKHRRFCISRSRFSKAHLASPAPSASCTALGAETATRTQTGGATVRRAHLKEIDCAPVQEDKRLRMREPSVTLSICRAALNDTSLSNPRKTKVPQRPCQWLLFHSPFHAQPFLFMLLPS